MLEQGLKMRVCRSNCTAKCTDGWLGSVTDRGLCAAQLRVDIVVERLENAFYDSKRETGFVGLRNQVPRAHPNSGTQMRLVRAAFQ